MITALLCSGLTFGCQPFACGGWGRETKTTQAINSKKTNPSYNTLDWSQRARRPGAECGSWALGFKSIICC